MIDGMTNYYINNTINKLNKSTIAKFADAQIGNYAAVFMELTRATKRQLNKRYNKKKLDTTVTDVLMPVADTNKKTFYSNVSSLIGIDRDKLIKENPLTHTTSALIQESRELVIKLKNDVLANYTTNALRIMSGGGSLSDVIKELHSQKSKFKNNASLIARQQVTVLNTMLTKKRAQNLGIKEAKWETAGDEKVRPSHVERDNKMFDLNKGLYSKVDDKTLLPGQDFNCRCISILILPKED